MKDAMEVLLRSGGPLSTGAAGPHGHPGRARVRRQPRPVQPRQPAAAGQPATALIGMRVVKLVRDTSCGMLDVSSLAGIVVERGRGGASNCCIDRGAFAACAVPLPEVPCTLL
jgi:hypothetical protein